MTGVQYMESGFFIVRVIIKKEFEKAVTEHARFFIVTDPQDRSRKTVEMVLIAKGGEPLEQESTVAGSSRPSALLDKIWKGLDDIETQWKEFSNSVCRMSCLNRIGLLEKMHVAHPHPSQTRLPGGFQALRCLFSRSCGQVNHLVFRVECQQGVRDLRS